MSDEYKIVSIILILAAIGFGTVMKWIYRILKKIITNIKNTIYRIFNKPRIVKREKRKRRKNEESYIDACWDEIKKY
jgi:hypothetical protein